MEEQDANHWFLCLSIRFFLAATVAMHFVSRLSNSNSPNCFKHVNVSTLASWFLRVVVSAGHFRAATPHMVHEGCTVSGGHIPIHRASMRCTVLRGTDYWLLCVSTTVGWEESKRSDKRHSRKWRLQTGRPPLVQESGMLQHEHSLRDFTTVLQKQVSHHNIFTTVKNARQARAPYPCSNDLNTKVLARRARRKTRSL